MDLMHLDKLVKIRETVSTKEFPIPVKELLARYEQLYTGAINDVLREHTLMDQALPSAIMPLRDTMKAAGIVFTIKSQPTTRITGEMNYRAKMLDAMPEDCICVWESSGDRESSLWGEVMTAASKARGARGAVIDGGIRDTMQVLEQNFPVFYRYRTSNGSLGRCLITGYQIPIRIERTFIFPGDVIFGDVDGVLAIPRDIAYEVLVRAEEIKSNEKRIRTWVDSGMKAEDVIGKGGYF